MVGHHPCAVPCRAVRCRAGASPWARLPLAGPSGWEAVGSAGMDKGPVRYQGVSRARSANGRGLWLKPFPGARGRHRRVRDGGDDFLEHVLSLDLVLLDGFAFFPGARGRGSDRRCLGLRVWHLPARRGDAGLENWGGPCRAVPGGQSCPPKWVATPEGPGGGPSKDRRGLTAGPEPPRAWRP